jgi:hypothetical protein
MFLNSVNKKIVEFLDMKNLSNLKQYFLKMLEVNKKLSKQEEKNILRLIRAGENILVERQLEEILIVLKIIKKNENSTKRVRKSREKKKEAGYKTVSFLLTVSEFEKIREMKSKKWNSYREFFLYLIEKHENS